MKTISDINEMIKIRNKIKDSVGFVPTMGALHEGHISLIKKAKKENKIVMVSIFVNPTQFNDRNDLKKYPRPISEDKKILKNENVDYLFLPDFKDIYPDLYRYKIIETDFSKKLCGKFREGHFDGVLTIVMKLLNITKPDKAYFGEKDFQQYILIKNMCKAFFISTQIIPCPIIREKDGLALSSRNLLLSKKDREKAPLIYKTIKQNITNGEVKKILSENGFKVEYVETLKGRRFIAAWLGNVRLIDNIVIKRREKCLKR